MAGAATILHADLDAFYASVEQMLDPSLRGKPIAVGGGVVLAASYEAKRFGVHGGMSGARAKQLCPGLLFVGGHYRQYQQLGDEVVSILDEYTPYVQRISIDEAFLDVGGSMHLFGSAEEIGRAIRRRVRDEIGLPISVGVARTKHLAKIGSQVAKPDGLVVIEPELEREFLDPLPVRLVWGIGPVTQQRLADRGIRTIGQLATADPRQLETILGRALGTKVVALAANDDARKVRRTERASSVGAQSAFGRRYPEQNLVRPVLGHLADRVAARLRRSGRAGRTVTVRIRFASMRSITRSHTSADPISTTLTLTDIAARLVQAGLDDHPDEAQISLLAISVSNLVGRSTLQLELALAPEEPERAGSRAGAARWAVDHSIDRVRERFGREAVGYASVVMSEHTRVPDEFRELAEHEL